MTSVLESLDAIGLLRAELDSLLSEELGKFNDGQQALWVEPPFIDSKRTFTGLKIVVNRNQDPLQPQQACVGVPQAIQRMFWRVALINNDFSNEGLMKWDSAIDKIRRRFPLHRERAVENTEDRFPQRNFLLDVSKIINLIT